MDWKTLRAHLSEYPGSVEEYPFGPETAVHKVGGKIFAFTSWDVTPPRLALKCDPDQAIALRHEFPSILPGYHLNKRHWNTIVLDGGVPEDFLTDLIYHSYELVVKGLTKAVRESLPRDTKNEPPSL
ncbi:MAG: MmcQ/YjbR family DNA-binding protein [Capsulimonas sp.]|uniref:MmcQ/YjbR family DNA-binding protein n=1 Tax=Capsulimonas sp. TaxID=2494211 RepID=UPI003263DBAF